MAAFANHRFGDLLGRFFKAKHRAFVESRRARDFANQVYKKTGGPTPEAKRLYAAFRASQHHER